MTNAVAPRIASRVFVPCSCSPTKLVVCYASNGIVPHRFLLEFLVPPPVDGAGSGLSAYPRTRLRSLSKRIVIGFQSITRRRCALDTAYTVVLYDGRPVDPMIEIDDSSVNIKHDYSTVNTTTKTLSGMRHENKILLVL
jgi:hypothetical protein